VDHTSHRVDFANALRGIAACCVVFYHFAIFWLFPANQTGWANLVPLSATPNFDLVGLYQLPMPWILQEPPSWLGQPLLDFGALGVALFFLISGFVIPLSFDKYSAKGFLVGRLFRIYPTYICGFSLVLFAMWVSGWVTGSTFPHDVGPVLLSYLPGLREFFSSAYIDPVVWSLEIELKFYIVCFFCAGLLQKRSVRIFFVPCALTAFAVAARFGLESQIAHKLAFDSTIIVFMFIGVALSYEWSGRLSRFSAAVLCLMLMAVFVGLWRIGVVPHAGARPSIALLGLLGHAEPGGQISSIASAYERSWAYGVALLTFVACMNLPVRIARLRGLRFFADVSYPLYIVHMAPGYMVISFASRLGFSVVQATAIAFAWVVALGYILHLCIERPTHKFGQQLASRMSERPGRGKDSAASDAVPA